MKTLSTISFAVHHHQVSTDRKTRRIVHPGRQPGDPLHPGNRNPAVVEGDLVSICSCRHSEGVVQPHTPLRKNQPDKRGPRCTAPATSTFPTRRSCRTPPEIFRRASGRISPRVSGVRSGWKAPAMSIRNPETLSLCGNCCAAFARARTRRICFNYWAQPQTRGRSLGSRCLNRRGFRHYGTSSGPPC